MRKSMVCCSGSLRRAAWRVPKEGKRTLSPTDEKFPLEAAAATAEGVEFSAGEQIIASFWKDDANESTSLWGSRHLGWASRLAIRWPTAEGGEMRDRGTSESLNTRPAFSGAAEVTMELIMGIVVGSLD